LFDINFPTKLVDDSRLSIMRNNVYAILEKNIVMRFTLASHSRWNISIYILAFKYIEILLFFYSYFFIFFYCVERTGMRSVSEYVYSLHYMFIICFLHDS